MTTKKCFKCLCEKPLEAFYKHQAMSDGRLGKCKECTKADVTKHRQENLEKIRAYDRMRGRVLVHAAKGMTRSEYEDGILFAIDAIRADPRNANATKTITLRDLGFAFDELPRGGIIGSVEIVDCVSSSDSPWFMGPYGFVFCDPQPLPFQPLKGALGFFEVPQ